MQPAASGARRHAGAGLPHLRKGGPLRGVLAEAAGAELPQQGLPLLRHRQHTALEANGAHHLHRGSSGQQQQQQRAAFQYPASRSHSERTCLPLRVSTVLWILTHPISPRRHQPVQRG